MPLLDSRKKPRRGSSVRSFGSCATRNLGTSSEFMDIVNNELKLTVDDETHNSKDGFTLDKLNITDLGLHGRSSEVALLLEAFESLNTSDDSKMVSILGSSGTGKSTLAQQLQGPVAQSGGFFITGKFDIQQRVEPYTAFVNAFTDLCDTILARDESLREEVMEKIKEALGSDGKALTDVIPSLKKIIGEQKDEADGGSMETRNRLHFLFRKFTRAVCSPSNPLVLILDDVQWADASSLELIETLVTDVDNSSLLLVVTCRDTETIEGNPFRELLRSIEKAEATNTKITLGNLDAHGVNSIVSTLLRSTEDVTKPLADIIHGKTLGNAFFVIEFIKSLVVAESLLRFNFGTLRWHWKKDQIQSMVVTDNVAELMTAKLEKLPPTCQLTLEVAACLGHSFDKGTLGFVMERVLESDLFQGHGSIEVGEMTERSVRDGLLEHEGLHQSADGPTYSFVHDQVQNAALTLIPVDKRPRLELLIGQTLLLLYEGAPYEKLDRRLFVAVDLCNRGVSFLGNEEKIKLAEYNALAGKKALEKSGFVSATQYMDRGLGYLGCDRWSEHYKLTLELSSGAAEAAYCSGKFDEMQKYLDQVMKQDCGINDKIRAYRTLILSLGAQGRFEEAIDNGLHVLKEMKIATFSKSATIFTALYELRKTQLLLKKQKKLQQPLSNLPILYDENRITAMGIIYMMTVMAYITNPNLFLVMFARVVRWNIKYGVCKYSPHAFGTYGVVLCGVFGDFKGSYQLGQEALELSQRLDARETLAKTIYAVYGFVHHWNRYMRSARKPLLYGHQVGMDTGEIEMAMYNLAAYVNAELISGSTNLTILAKKMKEACQKMRDYKQDAIRDFVLCLWQVTLNLLGQSKDPLVLTGEAMDELAMAKVVADTNNQALEMFLLSCRMELAYIFGDFELAGQLAESSKEYGVKVCQGELMVAKHTFFQGLIWCRKAAAEGRRKFRSRHVRRARAITKKMKKWVQMGNVNCLHQVQLLEAEMAFLNGREGIATKMYQASIFSAGRGAFVQDMALAHERAGIFHLEVDDDSYWAAHHFDCSIAGYQEWGAKAKVNQLVEKNSSILSEHGYNEPGVMSKHFLKV